MIDIQAVDTKMQMMAQQAGDVLLNFFDRPLTHKIKGSPYDVVTEADKSAEEVIVELIMAEFPDHHIIGEEGGGMGAAIETAEYRWYVDPLDGTTNYANHIPYFSTSLALTDRHMRPLAGVVYNPISKEMFSAVRGQGTLLNGQPITVSGAGELANCVVVSGFPYDKHTSPQNNIAEWSRFVTRTRGVRRFGSAALDLCFVAAGRFDGYWESKLHPWDLLAGVLCVIEAGGMVTDYGGKASSAIYEKGQLVASNGHIHAQMLALLAE